MTTPRDFLSENRTGLIKFARIYSNVISPPVMFALLGFAFALRNNDLATGLTWGAIYGALVSLAPIIVVFYLLQKGVIKELHMSDTRERHIPYFSSILLSAITWGILVQFDAPRLLICLAIFNTVQLALLTAINFYWLISIHATGIMASYVLVGLVWGWGVATILVMPFVLSVCWVRLYLKRHTPNQVMAGLALGALSVLSLTLVGCFQ